MHIMLSFQVSGVEMTYNMEIEALCCSAEALNDDTFHALVNYGGSAGTKNGGSGTKGGGGRPSSSGGR